MTGNLFNNYLYCHKMNLHQKIFEARSKQGLTQEELATAANVTVRTIQRIESGESVPRKYTLKLIAAAVNIPFEELNSVANTTDQTLVQNTVDREKEVDFLRLLCLSCFSYLLIPYLHFLIPHFLLKNHKEQNAVTLRFGRKLVKNQIYWVIGTTLIFLLVLGYNFVQAAYFKKLHSVGYVAVFFFTYFLNLGIIAKSFFSINEDLFNAA
jgi:transcriptional regulator with XRE-family HTH domain